MMADGDNHTVMMDLSPRPAWVEAWHLWTVFDARKIEGAQRRIWFIPGYGLIYVFAESESRYLRTYTVGVAAVVIAFFALGYDWQRRDAQWNAAHPYEAGGHISVTRVEGPKNVMNIPHQPTPEDGIEPPEFPPERAAAATRPAKKNP